MLGIVNEECLWLFLELSISLKVSVRSQIEFSITVELAPNGWLQRPEGHRFGLDRFVINKSKGRFLSNTVIKLSTSKQKNYSKVLNKTSKLFAQKLPNHNVNCKSFFCTFSPPSFFKFVQWVVHRQPSIFAELFSFHLTAALLIWILVQILKRQWKYKVSKISMTKLFTRTISIIIPAEKLILFEKVHCLLFQSRVKKGKSRKSISMGARVERWQREKSNLILCLNVFVSCLFPNVLSQLIPFKDHFDNTFL